METTNESGGKIYAAQRLLKQRVRKVFTHSCAVCYPYTSLLITLRLLTGTNFYSAIMIWLLRIAAFLIDYLCQSYAWYDIDDAPTLPSFVAELVNQTSISVCGELKCVCINAYVGKS